MPLAVQLTGRHASERRDWRSGAIATAILACVFVVALAAPIPDKTVTAKILLLASRRTPRMIVASGNSILTHTSRCDVDRSSLIELINERVDGRVHSVGHSGQEFPESMNMLALALRQSNVETALFLLNANQLREHGRASLQTQLFMMARASARFEANSLAGRFADGFALTGGEVPDSFRYAGTLYPDYEGRKAFFAREKAAMRCPETLGYQREFIEASYWNEYVAPRDIAANFEDLRALDELARELGKRLLVVLLPANFHDASALNPALGAEMGRYLDGLARHIAGLGVETLDLQRSASAEDFADRWCACGHMSERGRRWVAARVGERLLARP